MCLLSCFSIKSSLPSFSCKNFNVINQFVYLKDKSLPPDSAKSAPSPSVIGPSKEVSFSFIFMRISFNLLRFPSAFCLYRLQNILLYLDGFKGKNGLQSMF